MTDGLTISAATSLGADELAAITELVRVAAGEDGFTALNEAALLHLRHPRDAVVHVLARSGEELVGYAQLESHGRDQQIASARQSVSPLNESFSTSQLVVHPGHRRVGVGAALLAKVLALTTSPLRLWAMGNTPAARALAASGQLVAVRELLIMTRSLSEPVARPRLPGETTVRTFVVGQDEQRWLEVNARAFRDHPEQGQLTRADLDDRMSESWFDPAGFFLAVRRGAPAPEPAAADDVDATTPERIVGFHWTKQHPGRLGEVYVLGVEPSAGGDGLGKALLAYGLQHLQERGNTSVQLYVEAGHTRAVSLYAGYGFTVASRDVMYASS